MQIEIRVSGTIKDVNRFAAHIERTFDVHRKSKPYWDKERTSVRVYIKFDPEEGKTIK